MLHVIDQQRVAIASLESIARLSHSVTLGDVLPVESKNFAPPIQDSPHISLSDVAPATSSFGIDSSRFLNAGMRTASQPLLKTAFGAQLTLPPQTPNGMVRRYTTAIVAPAGSDMNLAALSLGKLQTSPASHRRNSIVPLGDIRGAGISSRNLLLQSPEVTPRLIDVKGVVVTFSNSPLKTKTSVQLPMARQESSNRLFRFSEQHINAHERAIQIHEWRHGNDNCIYSFRFDVLRLYEIRVP